MPLRRFLTDKATVWESVSPYPADPFQDRNWSRNVINCCIASGGKTQTDGDGAQFQPSTTYWSDIEIRRGARIKPGDHLDAKPPNDTETIRKSSSWSVHPAQNIRDYVGYTG